jgi:hypothetical protein
MSFIDTNCKESNNNVSNVDSNLFVFDIYLIQPYEIKSNKCCGTKSASLLEKIKNRYLIRRRFK